MKKGIRCMSIFLTIVFILGVFSSGQAFANEISKQNSENLISLESIMNNAKILNKKIKLVDDYNKMESNSFEENDVILDYSLLKDGSEEFRLIEQDITNIITLKTNGQVYLDGFPVTVQTLDDKGKVIKEEVLTNNNITTQANRVYHFSSPPAGSSASDYTTYLDTINKRVTFGSTFIKALAETAFFTIIAAAVLEGIPLAIASAVLGSAYVAAKNTIPNNNALSFKQDRYKKMYVGQYILVIKNNINFYANNDYTGWFSKSVHYVAYDS